MIAPVHLPVGVALVVTLVAYERSEALTADVHELASRAGSRSALSFRYRIEMWSSGDVDVVRDGVSRLEYSNQGLVIDELYVESSLKDPDPIENWRTYYVSLLTGESVAICRRPGVGNDLVLVDYWEGIPGVFYYALGLIGPRDADRTETLVRAAASSGRSSAMPGLEGCEWERHEWESESGARRRLGLAFDEGEPPSVESRMPSYMEEEILDDTNTPMWLGSWLRVEADWSTVGAGRAASPGTRVMDLRRPAETVTSVLLDRSLDIAEVPRWLDAFSWSPEPLSPGPSQVVSGRDLGLAIGSIVLVSVWLGYKRRHASLGES